MAKNKDKIVGVRAEGQFKVKMNDDWEYPDVDVEFQPAKKQNGTNPRVVFEYPENGELKILIWADRNKEEPSHEITVN